MGGLKSSMVLLMVLMVAAMQLHGSVAQTRHVVGDALGWTIPSGGPTTYTTWASQQNFTVGDTLVFNFTTGIHNVAEVSQAAYGPCSSTTPISIATTGPSTITLNAAGAHYYICTVGTHCSLGQKLTVNVSNAAAAPAPAPATPPPVPTPAPTPPSAPVSPPIPAPTPSAPSPAPTPSSPEASPPSPSSPEASPPTPSSPEASPPAPPTPGSSPPGSSPPSGSPPSPPAPSTATSFTVVVPVTFLAVALAFFY